MFELVNKEDFLDRTNVLDRYIVRTPTLPFHRYQELYECKSSSDEQIYSVLYDRVIEFICNYQVIENALAFASPSLYESIEKLKTKKEFSKNNLYTIKKTLRYLSRMCTRATPFGLFSGVFTGGFDLELNSVREPLIRKVQLRVDYESIFELIKDLEHDNTVMFSLQWRTNPTLLRDGARYVIAYSPKTDTGVNQTNTASINYTEASEFVLQACQYPRILGEIFSEVIELFPSASDSVVKEFLRDLCEQGFLHSELLPSPNDTSYLSRLQQRLRELDCTDKESVLHAISNDAYEFSRVGHEHAATHLLNSIRSKLVALPGANQRLSCVAKIGSEDFSVPSSWKLLIKKAAYAVWCLGTLSPMVVMEKYKSKFREIYGENIAVPFLELHHRHPLGLDLIGSYQGEDQLELSSIREHHLSRLIAQAEGKIEVELDDETLEYMSVFHQSSLVNMMPGSSELALSIYTSSEKPDEPIMVLSPLGGSDELARTVGRFLEILQDEAFEEQTTKYFSEGNEEFVYADLVYLPVNGEYSGLALAPSFSRFQISVGWWNQSEQRCELPLSDLYVWLQNNHLRIWSKKLQKAVKIRLGHSLNPKRFSEMLQTLYFISNETYINAGFPLGDCRVNENFFPRIRYGNVILRLAEWRIDKSMVQRIVKKLGVDGREWNRHTPSDVTSFVTSLREMYNVPRYCYMGRGDKRLLLDLEFKWHANELMDECRRVESGIVTLYEVFPLPEQSVLHDGKFPYESEFVYQLCHSSKYDSALNRVPTYYHSDLSMHLGSEWLFVKLYCHPTRAEALIRNLSSFCASMFTQGHIRQWFYIRYADPELHIRVRFQGTPTSLTKQVLPMLVDWSHQLLSDALATRWTVDTYLREEGRYGGIEGIEIAEEVFHFDSLYCIELLDYVTEEEVDFMTVIAVISSLEIAKCFWENPALIVDNCLYTRGKFVDEYRNLKPAIEKFIGYKNSFETVDSDVKQTIVKFSVHFRECADRLRRLESAGKLTVNYSQIVHSYIHMHLNRLLGPDRNMEEEILNLMARTASMMKHRPI